MGGLQHAISREQLTKANFRNAVVVLGDWRSGTTLLHELLCLDARYTYPTTHACMNPHHFLPTEAWALAVEMKRRSGYRAKGSVPSAEW
jgi:hypothetical protein